jgi:hypothetical protein
MQEVLTEVQEAEAQELARVLGELAREDLLRMARVLVATTPATVFGQTEFTVRDLAQAIAAKAYDQHLASKKTAMKAPA